MMLKVGSKRRRTKRQIKAEKEEKERELAEQAHRIAETDRFEARVRELENQLQTAKMASDLMSQFMNAGIIKQTDEDKFVVSSSRGEQLFQAQNK